jgi:hypothetical protein
MNNRRVALCLSALALLGCETKTQIQQVIQQVPPPEPVSTPLSIDVVASQVDGSFLLDGGAFPNPLYEIGELALLDTGAMSAVELGKSYEQGYDLMLVHGTYDSVYRYVAGAEIPVNSAGTIATGIVIGAPQTVNIDVPVATVRPQFLLNGVDFPASVYNHANFYLQPVTSDELIFLGKSHIANDTVSVLPGTYRVIYEHYDGALVPANEHARVMSDVVISGDMLLVVDVPAFDVRTSFSHNGAPFPASQYIRAEFYLVDATGDEVFIGNSYDGPDTISVVGGVYDVEYRHAQGGSIPLNAATVVASNVDLTSGGAVAVDVASFTLDINATLNGQPFPVSEYDDGVLELRDPVTGSYSMLGNTHSPFTGLVVIPGTYDIAYSHETGNDVPLNLRGVVASSYAVADNQQLDLDVTAHSLSLDLTLDTEAFPLSQYNYADILLTGDETTEDIAASTTKSQDGPFLVLPGTYDVIYACHQCSDIPFNHYATILDDYDIIADGVIAKDIESVRLETTATLNGNPFPQSFYESGVIFGELQSGDAVELTATPTTTDDVLVIAGDYTFYYQHANGDQVPANVWAVVGQQTLGP